MTNEFEKEYLRAALLQEVEYKCRQHRVSELVKHDEFATTSPTCADVIAEPEGEGYLIGSENEGGPYRFPQLRAFLEIGDEAGIQSRHQTGFSKPIRNAMDLIDSWP